MRKLHATVFTSLSATAAAFALSLLVAGPASAQGPNFPSGQRPDPEQACGGDAQRLCSQFIPDRKTTGACLRRNKRQLSPACASFFGGGKKLRRR
jgi:hypothetical protein